MLYVGDNVIFLIVQCLIERANKRKTPLTAHSFFVVKERFLLMAVKTDVFMLCCF